MNCENMNNNFDDGFNEARRIIEEAKRFRQVGVCCSNNGIPGPQGPVGPEGPEGPAGEDGLTPNITIGTVTTGDPGTEASASITGTAPNFVLNLTIPQGQPGA